MERTRQIRDEILALFRRNGTRTFRPKEVAQKLGYRSNEDYRLSRFLLEELESKGHIRRIKGNKFGLRPKSTRLEGRLSVHPQGYGFVRVEGVEGGLGAPGLVDQVAGPDPARAALREEERLGLVQQVVAAEALTETAAKLAKTIAARGPLGVAAVKKVIDTGLDEALDAGLESEAQAFAALFESEDRVEGTTAFLEKRKPAFTGR